MMKYAAAGLIVVLMGLGAIYIFYQQKVIVPDHLCGYVSDTLHFGCVDVLQAEDAMHPGAVLVYRAPVSKDDHARAEIPRLDLLKDSCRVPGTAPDAVIVGLDKPSQIGLPEFTYQVKGALEEGIDFPIPKLDGAKIVAGPKFSKVSNVKIANDKAWISTWDEGAAARAFTSCNIQQDCIDRIRSSNYKVVSSTAVVAGLSYDFSDSDNKTIALNGDASGAALKIDIGGNVAFEGSGRAKLDAKTPYVIGVNFFPDNVFAQTPTCAEPIHFSADATTTVTVSGGGGKGQIGGPFTVSAPLGQAATLSKKGTEQSECEAGLDLTTSEAAIAAQVASTKPGALEFSYDYHLSGGHYDTVDACPLGKWVGKHGHDNSANLSATLSGRVHVVLRTQAKSVIRVVHDDLPDSAIRVLDPQGEQVQELKPKPVEHKEGPPPPPPAPGNLYELTGPGAFTVDYSARIDLMQSGAGQESKSAKGIIEVHLD